MATYRIYCDESRQDNNEYKLIGGIWIDTQYSQMFVDEFHSIISSKYTSLPGHMKWTRVPGNINIPIFHQYLDLIDLYFKYNSLGRMYFKTIIADSKYNMKDEKFHHGDYEEGFYKLYYFLIIHSLRLPLQYHIRVAKRDVSKAIRNLDESARLDELKKALNNGVRKKVNKPYYQNIVLSVEARPAREKRLIQIADILMGAVGYQWCGDYNKQEKVNGKKYLCDYISSKLNKPNLLFTSSWNDRTFNIFKLNPGKC